MELSEFAIVAVVMVHTVTVTRNPYGVGPLVVVALAVLGVRRRDDDPRR